MTIIKFLCVSFNNADYSGKLVESLEHQQGRREEFSVDCVIVDNSTDDQDAAACERLAEKYSWVSYIRAPSNLGYFGGLNFGLEIANFSDSEYIILCNNDLEFDDDFCERLSQKTFNTNVLSVCPDVITADGIHQNPHILKKINWKRRFQFDVFFSHYYMSLILLLILRVIRPVKSSPPLLREGCETHMGVGACYVLTPNFFKRFKKLNYPFFLYGEEAYFADQIHSVGGVLWFDPDLHVRHAESATLSKVPNRTAYEFARSGYPDYRKLL
jgi:GT2 family glycosyltransferase